jgi:phospholipid N-methyltransferase
MLFIELIGKLLIILYQNDTVRTEKLLKKQHIEKHLKKLELNEKFYEKLRPFITTMRKID